MWFQALEFSISCTVAWYIFFCLWNENEETFVCFGDEKEEPNDFSVLGTRRRKHRFPIDSSFSFFKTGTQILGYRVQYKKPKFQAPGSTSSNFIDKVRPREGCEKCCHKCCTHGSALRMSHLPCDAFDSMETKIPQQKKTAADVIPVSLLSGVPTISIFSLWAVQHR